MSDFSAALFWKWAEDADSTERSRRIAAENNADVYSKAIEIAGSDVTAAVKLIIGLADQPSEFTPWHVEKLAYGPGEEAVHRFGDVFLFGLHSAGGLRIQAVLSLLEGMGSTS